MKTLKLTIVALLGLALATTSCKKEEAPQAVNNDNNTEQPADSTGNGGSSSNSGASNTDSTVLSFLDLVDNIAGDSTITYDSLLMMSNTISFVDLANNYAGIDVLTANNGGMTQNDYNTDGSYSDRLSAVRIYNETAQTFQTYTLVSTNPYNLVLGHGNGQPYIILRGTFVNTANEQIVIPELVITVQ